ncbi:ABC transporter transmembrane domain-containing protein [Lactobacillus crispatus]|uniref:ABC transporter transmembrane domain-containing protein n=1 Tax=Lactobacillus crispatus TaxID=47770 RepID=UPI001E3B4F27|nr:ABC transporter transmembrane domain-containing protein [Lactobacillus crispatus]
MDFVPLILIVSLLTVLLPQIIHKKLANAGLSTTKANERLLNVINDSLRGFTTFSIFGMERQLEKRIIGTALSVANKKIKQEKYQAVANNLAGFSNIIGQTGIQAWTGFLALNKIISIGVIGSSGNLSYNVFNSLAVIAPDLDRDDRINPYFEKYHLDNNQNSKQEGYQLTDFKFKSLSTRNLQMTFDHKEFFNIP